jgi:hypothetical protein
VAHFTKQGVSTAAASNQVLECPERAGVRQVAGISHADEALPREAIKQCVFHLLIGEIAVELLEDNDLE